MTSSAHEYLDRLAGKWSLNGTMGTTPLQQAVEGQWVLGDRFIQLYFKSTLPAPENQAPYEALYHIGYNAENDVYVMHLLDTFGVSVNCIAGLGKREGDSVPFVFAYETGPFTNRMTWQAASESWVFEQTYLQDGVAQVFATKQMVRAA